MIHRTRLTADPLSLPQAARDAYHRDGVLVIEDFATAADCERLRDRALALIDEHAPSAPGTIFSTRDQRHARDAYFEESANRIGVFYEEGAFDGCRRAAGAARERRQQARPRDARPRPGLRRVLARPRGCRRWPTASASSTRSLHAVDVSSSSRPASAAR